MLIYKNNNTDVVPMGCKGAMSLFPFENPICSTRKLAVEDQTNGQNKNNKKNEQIFVYTYP